MDYERINTVQLHGLTLGYGERTLFADAGIGFGWGEFTALIGRNGTGKSTLLRTVAGLARPQAGYITVNGRRTDTMSRREIAAAIAFVSTEEVKVENLKVTDVVALGRAPYTNWIGHMQQADRDIVSRSLSLVGMSSFARKTMDRMSDGECQRILIARALAQDTPVILLDEPTAFLDLPNRYELASLLRRLAHEEGKCIFFSTHDLDVALGLCDATALIDTPALHCMSAADMAASGHIERLFAGAGISFDPATLTIRLAKK